MQDNNAVRTALFYSQHPHHRTCLQHYFGFCNLTSLEYRKATSNILLTETTSNKGSLFRIRICEYLYVVVVFGKCSWECFTHPSIHLRFSLLMQNILPYLNRHPARP